MTWRNPRQSFVFMTNQGSQPRKACHVRLKDHPRRPRRIPKLFGDFGFCFSFCCFCCCCLCCYCVTFWIVRSQDHTVRKDQTRCEIAKKNWLPWFFCLLVCPRRFLPYSAPRPDLFLTWFRSLWYCYGLGFERSGLCGEQSCDYAVTLM